MDRSAKIALALLLLTVGASAFLLFQWSQSREELAFFRDDSAKLPDDDTSLRDAYAFLRKGGYRVALQTPDNARPPPVEHAWWIFQSDANWFARPEARAAEIKRFAEAGGTVVIAPAEELTDDDEAVEQTEVQKTSDRFFKALGLDVQVLAFDDDGEDAAEGDDDAAAADDTGSMPTDDQSDGDDDGSGFTLPVVGHGPHFDNLDYVQTDWGNFWSGEDLLKGDVRLDTDGFPLVVEFAFGRGRIVLVAESTYFENEFLGDAHNLALLKALADAYGTHGISLYAAR